MGTAQPQLHAAPKVHAASSACRIQQRAPLFVGFAPGATLNSFEESAIASRKIVREVKHWVCGASTSLSVAVPSLQLAFARSEALELSRVQFDDLDLVHAHVVLSSMRSAGEQEHWRVDLSRQPEEQWRVMATGIARPEDLPEEDDSLAAATPAE